MGKDETKKEVQEETKEEEKVQEERAERPSLYFASNNTTNNGVTVETVYKNNSSFDDDRSVTSQSKESTINSQGIFASDRSYDPGVGVGTGFDDDRSVTSQSKESTINSQGIFASDRSYDPGVGVGTGFDDDRSVTSQSKESTINSQERVASDRRYRTGAAAARAVDPDSFGAHVNSLAERIRRGGRTTGRNVVSGLGTFARYTGLRHVGIGVGAVGVAAMESIGLDRTSRDTRADARAARAAPFTADGTSHDTTDNDGFSLGSISSTGDRSIKTDALKEDLLLEEQLRKLHDKYPTFGIGKSALAIAGLALAPLTLGISALVTLAVGGNMLKNHLTKKDELKTAKSLRGENQNIIDHGQEESATKKNHEKYSEKAEEIISSPEFRARYSNLDQRRDRIERLANVSGIGITPEQFASQLTAFDARQTSLEGLVNEANRTAARETTNQVLADRLKRLSAIQDNERFDSRYRKSRIPNPNSTRGM